MIVFFMVCKNCDLQMERKGGEPCICGCREFEYDC